MVHYSQSIEKDAIVTMFQQTIKLTLLKKHFGLFLGLSISQDVKTIRNGNYKCKNVIILRCYKNNCYHSITQLLFYSHNQNVFWRCSIRNPPNLCLPIRTSG